MQRGQDGSHGGRLQKEAALRADQLIRAELLDIQRLEAGVKIAPLGEGRLLDGGEADDKIIAVMKGDEFYRQWNDVSDCPTSYIDRLRHYFLTYKHLPSEEIICEITHVYGREEACEVIRRAMADYQHHYGHYTI